MNIIRGTTPAVVVKYATPVGNISKAYLTVDQNGVVLAQHQLSEADVNALANTLTWSLTQEETLKIEAGRAVKLQVTALLTTGTRLASKMYMALGADNLKDEVI